MTVPLALYVGLATRLIMAHVGYETDEALFVESAVFMLRGSGVPPFLHDAGSWITVLGRSWPLMIIPYVGTTKAFVALPLFAIFGITAEVARFAGVLLGCLGIAGLVVLIGNEISPVTGLIVGVLLAIHPSYLGFTVFDNSGVSVWMAAMGIGALALANYLRRRSALPVFLLGVAVGLGIWARANVLWLIGSVIVAAFLLYGLRVIPPKDHIRVMTIGGCFGALPLIAYEVGSRLATFRFILKRHHPVSISGVMGRLRALAELLVSDGEQQVIWWGPRPPSWQVGIGATLLALVLFCVFVRIPAGNPAISRWRRAFALTAVVLTLIMLTSGLDIDQHHLVAVLPLALGALAVLSGEVAGRFRRTTPLIATAAAGLAVLSLSWDARIDHGLRRTGGEWVWSSGIHDVSRYLESHPVPPDRLKILHWGFQNNLYVVSRGSVYGSELFWSGTKTHSSRGLTWESEIRDGGWFLRFVLPTGSPSLSAAAEGFSEAMKNYSGPRRETRFFDRSGSPVAVLVEIFADAITKGRHAAAFGGLSSSQ